jgi:hypothetical protein
MRSPKTKLGLNLSMLGCAVLACASLLSGTDARGGSTTENIGGTKAIYGNIPPDQIEFLSTGDRIKSVAASGSMMAIWETLEHGERVECLDCIPSVEPLLYNPDPRTREIAAWWLRRRVFGVFGKGEVYERTLQTLASDPLPTKRAYAAYALGEFLAAPGIEACASAIDRDGDPTVRAAAATALGRLNDDGRGALTKALGDTDARMKLAGPRRAHEGARGHGRTREARWSRLGRPREHVHGRRFGRAAHRRFRREGQAPLGRSPRRDAREGLRRRSDCADEGRRRQRP